MLRRRRPAVGDALVRIVRLVLVGPARPPREQARAHFATTQAIADTVLENAKEERPPLLARASPVTARELKHRVLNDVERIVIVANGDPGDSVRPLFDIEQKTVE